MTEDIKSEPTRDIVSYKFEFDSLPFERILEGFRRRKILEILGKLDPLTDNQILEIGPGYNALSMDLFVGAQVTMIEPSKPLFEHNLLILKDNRYARVLHLDIQDFVALEPNAKFDLVILSSVLHEFLDPRKELQRICSVMISGGSLILVVPNNQSVHRLFGVTMGILPSTDSQTETERIMQQNTNFSVSSLSALVSDVGFEISFCTTHFVKPHTHSQMQSWVDSGVLSNDRLEDFYNMSELFHPFNAEIFMLVVKK